MVLTSTPSHGSDVDLRDLIQALPLKADLQGLSSKARLQNLAADIKAALRTKLVALTKLVEDTAVTVTGITT